MILIFGIQTSGNTGVTFKIFNFVDILRNQKKFKFLMKLFKIWREYNLMEAQLGRVSDRHHRVCDPEHWAKDYGVRKIQKPTQYSGGWSSNDEKDFFRNVIFSHILTN